MPITRSAAPPRNPLVVAEQIRALYSQLPKSTAGMVAAGLVVIGAMWSQVPHAILLTWFGVIILNQSWRLALYVRYRSNPPAPAEAQHWGRVWTIGAGLSGLIWGSAGVLMFVPGAPDYQAFLIVALFAVTTGALTLIAVHAPSFYAFVLPTILPIIIRTALEAGAVHLFTAAACSLVLITLLAFGRNLNRLLTQSLHTRFDNVELIAELKAQQQVAEAATRAKTQFFAAANHDLRQPLHAMGLFASALAAKPRDPEVDKLVDSINASVHALEALFNELLDISKIDAGAVKPELRNFSVQTVLARVGEEFRVEAAEKGLRFTLDPHDSIVHSDAMLLERILRNLVANAIRYTAAGTIRVWVEPAADVARISVHDTGIGIAPEHQQRIFEEFFQLGNPARTSRKGLGLGLSIVKRLCDLLGHPLSVATRLGAGSTFTIEVPLATVAATAAPVAAPVFSPAVDLAGRLIVVIDDEIAIVEGMQALLTGLGATVIGSTSGQDVIGAVHAAGRLPDLIIIDYRLGDGVDGIEVVQRIRQALDPEIPAILVSGTMSPTLRETADHARLQFLLKPVMPDRLCALIRQVLESRAG
jgi:signal transduction histidine kinase/CheY-like chemotaxis protein